MIGSGERLLHGRYEVLDVRGRGGEGTVLRARDQRHDRLVALKRRRLSPDAPETERFLLEARTLLSLRPHPGLPTARDDFFEGDHHYLVLDWIDGVDLASFLDEHGRPGLPAATVLRWLAPVAAALTHLHQSDPPIVHGDVKPDNLILTSAGHVVLVDFGTSSTRGWSGRGGTPGFRAPEAATDAAPTRAVDVYGLAATAFALLTGAPPAGLLPDWGGTDQARAARLETALRRGLATDPRRRTPTPGALVEELRAGWDAPPIGTGVFTYLVADAVIPGQLWHERPHEAIATRARYAVLLDDALDQHGGRRAVEVPAVEAATAIFERAGDAVGAALALQRAAIARSIPVRCALDTGEAVDDEQFLGATQVRAGRVRELARPGQVLLTELTARLVAPDLPSDASTIELGPHQVVGFDVPEVLFAVDAPGIAVPRDPNRCPYPGLVAFQAGDDDLFFGREDVVAELATRVERASLVGIVGASGSGKSSVLRAGLAPSLTGSVVVTPTDHPMEVLRSIPPEAPLIVDQLEELFTLCTDRDEANQFVSALLQRTGPTAVAIRVDMFGSLSAHPELATAVAAEHVLLSPMTTEQLRRAIAVPAAAQGLDLEPGLVDLALADGEGQPGVLPHLAHALRETWVRREGRTLTLRGYRSAGGVRGALVQTAEAIYGDATDDERRLLRSVLLRLVEVGDGTQVFRRRAAIAELSGGHSDHEVRSVVTRLADARLVTIDADGVEPAHEALLRDWPRLSDWIDGARDDLRLQRTLATATSEWVRRDRDPADLFRGSRLAAAEEWWSHHPDEISQVELEFILESREHERDELAGAQRSARRLRRLLIGLVLVLAIALGAAAVALVQRSRANQEAASAEAHELAAEAVAAAPTQLDTALLLAAEAFTRERSSATEDALATALNSARFMKRSHLPIATDIDDLAVTRDGRTLVVLDFGGALSTYDTRTWEPVSTRLVSGIDSPYNVAVSHDGEMVAFGAADGVHIVRLADGSEIIPTIAGPQGIGGLFSSHDDRVIATFEGDNRAKIVDLASGETVAEIPVEGRFPVVDVRPGHDEIAVASFGGTAITTYLVDGTPTGSSVDLGGSTAGILSLAYSTDGSLVATASVSGTVDLFDADTFDRAAPAFAVAGSQASDLAFSSDGSRLLVGSDDGSARIFSIAESRVEATVAGLGARVVLEFIGDDRFVVSTMSQSVEYDLRQVTALGETADHQQEIRDVVPSSDGSTAFVVEDHRIVEVAADLDDRSRTWETPDFKAVSMAGAPDGRSIAVETFTLDASQTAIGEGMVNIIELETGAIRSRFALMGDDLATRMEYSPDGSKLAVVTRAGYLTIVDPIDGRPLLAPVSGDPFILLGLRWSQDGSSLYIGGQEGVVREIDPDTGASQRQVVLAPDLAITDIDLVPHSNLLVASSESGEVFTIDTTSFQAIGEPMSIGATELLSVAVSADGRVVAATSRDGALRVWDLPSRTPLAPALVAHDRGAIGVVVLPSGTVTVGGDGTVVTWDLDADVWRERACELAGRNLSAAEWTRLLPGDEYRETCPGLDTA